MMSEQGKWPEYEISDYAPGQWWMIDLESHWSCGTSNHNTRRAAKVALGLADLAFKHINASLDVVSLINENNRLSNENEKLTAEIRALSASTFTKED